MKILLIDDEEDIRKIGRLSLEAVGKFEAVIAPGPIEGLAAASSEHPDLILMDMMMPLMDGLAVLAQLRQSPILRSIPVIFMTAKVQRDEIEHYLRMGAIGVIQKPFDPMTLPDQIREIVARCTR